MKCLTPSAQRILGARNFRHAQVELSTAIDQLYAALDILRREIPLAKTNSELGVFKTGSLTNKSQQILEIAHVIAQKSWVMETNAKHLGPKE